MSHERDLFLPAKGPQDNHWLRTYRGIGLRIDNWRMYQTSPEHFQCPDCGYYWPTENGADYAGNTDRRGGRCWQCWMHHARPDELMQIKAQASALGKPAPKEAAAASSVAQKMRRIE